MSEWCKQAKKENESEKVILLTRTVFRFSFVTTYLRIKAVLEGHNVGMRVLDKLAHNLQLPILESLVLQDLFDRNNFPSLHHFGLKDHAKRSVSNDTLRRVRYVLFRQGTLGIIRHGSSARRVCHTLCGGYCGY
jgi:hypothetical protein